MPPIGVVGAFELIRAAAGLGASRLWSAYAGNPQQFLEVQDLIRKLVISPESWVTGYRREASPTHHCPSTSPTPLW
jgi:hypothetical protein